MLDVFNSPTSESNIVFLTATSSCVYSDETLTSENVAVTPSVAKKPTVLASNPVIVCTLVFSSEKSGWLAT